MVGNQSRQQKKDTNVKESFPNPDKMIEYAMSKIDPPEQLTEMTEQLTEMTKQMHSLIWLATKPDWATYRGFKDFVTNRDNQKLG